MAYRRKLCFFSFLTLLLGAWTGDRPATQLQSIDNPILFVTQVPTPADFTTVASVFGNQRSDVESAPRGGDLMIRYPDGTLRNLTKLAGYGMDGMQGANAIAVREPAVHWGGTKALFSMVIGSPTEQFVSGSYRWQIYEITGLGKNDPPVIRKIPNQPAAFNNVSPIYGTDDRILFTSDRPRNGAAHLYPQLDEYEEAAVVTGIWSLDPIGGDLFLLDHAPSGDFSPSIDSFGRVVFTRWDHLQRDQQADGDAGGGDFGTFDYADESATATRLPRREEVYPEPRSSRTDLLRGTNLEGHSFNQFFPWTINEDGTAVETLSHIGRHELQTYFNRSLNDDPNLEEFTTARPRTNSNDLASLLQMREDPQRPGTYFGIDAPEFSTHAAGQLVSINAPPSLRADQIQVTWVTARSTAQPTAEGMTPPPDHTGLYRNPLPLADGTLVVVHTAETRSDGNEGTREKPRSRYDFRLKTIQREGTFWRAGDPLTAGISKAVSYFDPDVLVSFSGNLWELDPVEVRARPRPARLSPKLEQQELDVFSQEGVNVSELKKYLQDRSLALIVSRDVTVRDAADRQQPFNLSVAGSAHQTVARPGKIYALKFLDLFQADQIRGIGGMASPREGRRVLAQRMHDPAVRNPNASTNPAGSVRVAADGSVAAFVPARRAMTWQTSDASGTGVVRERYWLTFQPGEIRVCVSCHGVNSVDQIGRSAPVNQPEALREILRFWKSDLKPAGRRRAARR
ncbi:MAG TPA: hypothetical protein VHL58_02900 [Thermoanaerobaculia bacterium]|nr:hypothetical protein [Thermoanaerobaculia bacterium]